MAQTSTRLHVPKQSTPFMLCPGTRYQGDTYNCCLTSAVLIYCMLRIRQMQMLLATVCLQRKCCWKAVCFLKSFKWRHCILSYE